MVPGSIMPAYPWLAKTELDARDIRTSMKIQAFQGVPYTPEMIENAEKDVIVQATTDSPDADALTKRYPKAQVRKFSGGTGAVNEADALIAYLQMLGTLVDFKVYDGKANLR
jgi:cytochrome c oxidase cbb3-type subunit 2